MKGERFSKVFQGLPRTDESVTKWTERELETERERQREKETERVRQTQTETDRESERGGGDIWREIEKKCRILIVLVDHKVHTPDNYQ